MDKVNVDKVVTYMCVLLLMLAVTSLFASCGQVRYVATASQHLQVDERVKHDTIEITRVVRERVMEKEKDSTTVVLDDKGRETFRERIRDRYIFIENRDSVNYYRSMADSLRSEVSDSIQIPVVIEKKLSRWQHLKMEMGGIAICAVWLILIVGVARVIKK